MPKFSACSRPDVGSSGAFLFHGRGVPLKLGFLHELDAPCRDYSMSLWVRDVAAVCFLSRVIDNHHVNENR